MLEGLCDCGVFCAREGKYEGNEGCGSSAGIEVDLGLCLGVEIRLKAVRCGLAHPIESDLLLVLGAVWGASCGEVGGGDKSDVVVGVAAAVLSGRPVHSPVGAAVRVGLQKRLNHDLRALDAAKGGDEDAFDDVVPDCAVVGGSEQSSSWP